MNLEKIIAVRTLKTVYKDGKNAIKMFDENYSKANILNEALNQARIEETSINSPKVVSVDKINNRWAIISEYIKGKNLHELMEMHPEREDEYLNLFVDLQISIHNTKAPILNRLKDKMAGKIELTDLSATTRYDLRMRLDSMPKHNYICHGDFNPSNVIIRDDGIPFVIDWSHVTRGNASADVARTYLLFNLEGKSEVAYKYLNLYCKKTNKDKNYIKKWLPIVAASQSVKGYKKEREYLLSWVNGMNNI